MKLLLLVLVYYLHFYIHSKVFDYNIFPLLNCENVSILERPHKLLLIIIVAKKIP